VHDQPSVVAEGTESFGEKTQVTVPKNLSILNGKVSIEENSFHREAGDSSIQLASRGKSEVLT
jgi:hypothetical protein